MNDQKHESRRMGRTMQVFAWLAVMALLMLYFGDVLDRQRNPNRSVDTAVTAEGVREVELRRNRMGHYVSAGTINGEDVVFLLDTGATGVAIPAALAERLSLPRGRAILTNTANGSTRSYLTRLQEVAVGDIRLQNVEASITPGLQMQEVLLGMSFLKYIEFTQRGSTLTLRQYPQD
ncbi:MAG: aspartyl protease family protein [Glaciecola sp.]|uniref:retropepsin-like aspartic protease family protein n=1 Tax=Congregibacter sp. TaxID=2744308 RepID=UPI0039E729B4